MCEAGKVGIWLTPEEAKVISNALQLLSSRIETAAIVYLDGIMKEIEQATRKVDGAEFARFQKEPDEEEEVIEEQEETTEIIETIRLPADEEEENKRTAQLTGG